MHLQVTDLSRSIEYYERVVGLRVIDHTSREAALGSIDSNRPLLRLEERRPSAGVGRPQRLGLYHFALLLPSRQALGHFIRHLSSLGAPMASADHAVSEAVYLWDPDRLGIEVYADRPRSAWRRRGDELVMTTQALDLGSFPDARVEAWRGMPPTTSVGHLHLHVGDLDRAEAFYHRALGFDKTHWSYPGALFLAAGQYHHHLGVNTWAGRAQRRNDDEPGLLSWELTLPSTDAAAAAAESCRVAGSPVRAEAHGWIVADPWGTELVLSAS